MSASENRFSALELKDKLQENLVRGIAAGLPAPEPFLVPPARFLALEQAHGDLSLEVYKIGLGYQALKRQVAELAVGKPRSWTTNRRLQTGCNNSLSLS